MRDPLASRLDHLREETERLIMMREKSRLKIQKATRKGKKRMVVDTLRSKWTERLALQEDRVVGAAIAWITYG